MDIGGSGERVAVEDAVGGVVAALLIDDLSCGLDG